MAKDLRSFLEDQQRCFPEEFLTIKKPVDPRNWDISAILEHLRRQGRFEITMFEQPLGMNGKPSPFRTLYNAFATRQRCADAIEFDREQWKMPLSEEFGRLEEQVVEPVTVAPGQAPVKEVVQRGEECDVGVFPGARYHHADIGPYFVMTMVLKDEEGGFYDISFAKNLYKGPRKVSASLTLPHLKRIFEQNEKKGKETPCIIVLGHHPAFYWGSLALTPFGNDDYRTVGAFLREPLRLTPSETWGSDFMVPADAEIVIEGVMPPGVREVQNPFGEISGHYQPQMLRPIVNVTAITHRHDAILQGVYPGHEAHYNLGAIPKEGSIYKTCKKLVPYVTAVHYPHSGCGRMSCYISIKKRQEGDAKRVGLVPLVESAQMQLVVVVDDDIDVFNETEVIWAVITNAQPSRDWDIIKNIASIHSWTEKVVIDATEPLDIPFPERIKVPEQALERVKLADYL
ncbi:MAG: UbiD family decarboxylase [Candidatus Tectomicrobia bacterium]|nr:UbiD family decarboxylase [Candidatus Tectomicrobia bacterium]